VLQGPRDLFAALGLDSRRPSLPGATYGGQQLHHTVSDTNSKWKHGSQLLYARTSVRSERKLDHCLTR
jgi:hypothetical protein